MEEGVQGLSEDRRRKQVNKEWLCLRVHCESVRTRSMGVASGVLGGGRSGRLNSALGGG